MAVTGGVSFIIDAQTVEFNRKMALANASMQRLGVTAGTVSKQTASIGTAATVASAQAVTGFTRLEKVVKRVRTVMVSVGVSLATIAGLAAMGKLIAAAVEFETAFAGVQKTVDATVPELAALRNEIRQMAKEIPLTTTELSKIGEVGGQLGISVQNMGRFIGIIAKLGVATTMSIDDAAMSVARFAAIMRTSEEDYERLASTLVHLGNNFAATEQEIMTMSLRIAGAGKQVGMTEDQVLSLATALTAVGIRAEAGGTAISRTMIEIDKQVAIAGDRLASFAKVAGLGVTAFAQLWKKDAMSALQLFIEGLSRLEARGGNASIVLQELGLGAVRVSDTLRRASSAHELLNKTLKFGAEGWRENIALQREADIRFGTMASQFKMLLSRVNDLAISMGEELLPALLGTARGFVKILEVTNIFSLALTALKVGALYWLIKTGFPALWAWGIKLYQSYKLTSAGILLVGKQTDLLAAKKVVITNLTKSQLAHNQALMAQDKALIVHSQALVAAQVHRTRAMTGNIVTTKTLGVATANLTKANVAVTAASAQVAAGQVAVAASTKAVTTATLAWSAALKTILPLLALYIGYKLTMWFYEVAKAEYEAMKATQALREEYDKYKKSLEEAGFEIKNVGELHRSDLGGVWAYSLGIEQSANKTKEYGENLAKTTEELKKLDIAVQTGIGSFAEYYTIVKSSSNENAKVIELQRKLYESLKELRNNGQSWNQIIGDNEQALKGLLQISFLYGLETTAIAEALQEEIEKFDLAKYGAENLEEALSVLDETQRKLYDSVTATLNPLKKFEDEINAIIEINKKLEGTGLGINLDAYYTANAKAIVDAAKKQKELGIALKDTQILMVENAKKFLKSADAIDNATGSVNKYVDAFKKAINPTIELGKKIRALQDAGVDTALIIRLYGKEIIKATDTARKFGQAIDATVAPLEAQARALEPPTHELAQLNFQAIVTKESQEKFLEIVKRLPGPVGDLAEVIKYLGGKFEDAKSPVDALSESLQKGWIDQLNRLTILPEAVADQLEKMDIAGLNAAQKMHLFGGSIKEAAEWLILLDRPLTEAEQGIVDIAATATDTSKIIQKQISTIITDLGKGFADIIVEWQGLWTSLKDSAKDFAKSILRIFFESLFTPIMQGFANIMGGVKGGFMGGFNQAEGFGGITGIFKALGGLFTGGGGGGAAGFGGFTDAAAGMTMMDTAATSASLSLTGLTTSFSELGATIATGAASVWEFLTIGIAGGPWGLVIAGAAAAALVLWKTVFSKSAYEKFALEFARDFGDIVISDDAIKNFANSLGITEEQLAKVRKDVASSPAFLMIGYNAAVAQGKVEQFLTSLESIETAWGTFDFRKAFETGIDTGNWLDLNEAFVEAFGSDLLKDIFGEDLTGLLIEMDEEMIKLVLRTRELQGALETLRDEPVRVAAAMDTLVSSIQILRDAGATDAEIMKILGEDMEVVTAAAHQLGVTIPPVVQELLALDLAVSGVSEAFQEGYAIWGNFIDQGEKLSDTILGLGAKMLELYDVAEAQEMTWGLLGGDILNLANSYIELGRPDLIPPVIQATLDYAEANGHARRSADGLYHAMGELSSAYQEGANIWKDFEQSAWDLQDRLMGLGDQLLNVYDTAEAQRIAWQFLGDDIISLANSYDGIIDVLPPVIQLALEWAEAAGLIERNAEGAWAAVEGLTGAFEGLNAQQQKGLQSWKDTLTVTQELADFMEGWQLGAIGTLGLDLSNVDDQTRLALLSWNEFGAKAISDANDMISKGLGEFIDARTLQMLEWARYMGLVTQTANGMWKAIEGPGAAMQKPYWLENWAAEMDSVYGPAWRNWQQYKSEWGGTGPGTARTGEMLEFPFPDPEDYPISETAELSTRMGELHDVLRDLIGGIRRLADSLRGLGEGVRSVIFDPTIGLPANPPSPLNPPGTLPAPIGEPGGVIIAPPLGPGLPIIPDPTQIPPNIPTDDSGDRPDIGRPGRKFGTDYVSQDMVALLHKGERVVPASENKPGGFQSSGTTVNITIQGPVYGLDDLDRKIANSVRKTFKAGGLSFLGDS